MIAVMTATQHAPQLRAGEVDNIGAPLRGIDVRARGRLR